MSFSLESALGCTVQLHEQSVGFWCPDMHRSFFPPAARLYNKKAGGRVMKCTAFGRSDHALARKS
jgi:hypothetical protein